MTFSDYQRLVIAFHGCDRKVASDVFKGAELKTSLNDYDWLGTGIYFWEHGPARALEWAKFMSRRKKGRVNKPAVVGALIQLGNCFDLLDVKFTRYLSGLFPRFVATFAAVGNLCLKNQGVFHRLDCAFINWAIPEVERDLGTRFQTVRGVFIEGQAAFPSAHIFQESHIQIAVRDPLAIVGYFHPSDSEEQNSLNAGSLYLRHLGHFSNRRFTGEHFRIRGG